MTKEKFHIDNCFTDGLNDLEVTPPPDVWNNIEKHLDKKKKVRIIFIWSAMAAGLALLIGIGSYMRSDSQQNTNTTKQTSIAAQQQEASKTQSLPDLPATSKNNSVVSPGDKETKDISSNSYTNNVAVSSVPSSKKHLKKDVQETTQPKNDNQIANESNSTNPLIKNEKESTQIDQIALSDHNNKAKVSYLIPFGSNLQSKTRQGLIIKPANFQEVTTVNETNPLLPEIAEIHEVQKIKKWSIAGQVAPLYSYRTSNQTNTSDQNKEKGLIAYSGGIKVDYKTSRRLSIQAGVYYSVMGQTIDNVKISSIPTGNQVASLTGDQITSSKGNINIIVLSTSNSMGPIAKRNSNGNMNNPNSINFYSNVNPNPKNDLMQSYNNTTIIANAKDGNIVQKLDFIEIPLLARYKIIDKKVGVHLLGGFSTNFLVNNYATLNQDGNSENIGQTEGLNNVNYSSTIGFGINYELFKKLDISFEPTYKYYLKSISSNKDNDFRPYSFGLFTGLTYKF